MTMDLNIKFITFELFAYLCGSIPFGLIISKLVRNIDIREYGSHNIGSTNVARTMGKMWGALVLLLDGMKAVVALLVVRHFCNATQLVMAFTTLVVVIGHIFPIWLHFKGGKGIACILFSLFVLNYKLGFTFLVSWIIVFLFFRISSISALVATIITTITAYFVSEIYFGMMILLALLTFYKHKDNISRILSGEELKFKKDK